MRPRILLLVAIGGVVGALARLAIAELMVGVNPSVEVSGLAFPWPTLVVNIVGCLAIGLVNPILLARSMPAGRADALQAFWVTGLLGGFTTFSAFAGEAVLLARDETVLVGLLYVAVTLAGGLLAVAAGSSLARHSSLTNRQSGAGR